VLALVIIETVVVALLAVLVVGLLRSHADILRALHSLGAGVGDPAAGLASAGPTDVPVQLGPSLPRERSTGNVADVVGVSPEGDPVAVAVTGTPRLTLLAFLSSGCASCAGFWTALGDPGRAGLPGDVRVVAVTKGPELESPAEVRARAAGRVTVAMSSTAWDDYEVPGSPFFVLIDGGAGRARGGGVASALSQVADLGRRAQADAGLGRAPARATAAGAGQADAGDPRMGLGGPGRESLNDQELLAAGITPDHPSLYPQTLDDVFANGEGARGQG
jgi:hypothetical protein